MYAEEMLRRGSSTLGSCQELLDYVPRFSHPNARFDVPCRGFNVKYSETFNYILNHRFSPEAVYPWFAETTYSRVETDWDRRARFVKLKALNPKGRSDYEVDGVIPLEDKISLERYEKIAHYEEIAPTSDSKQLYEEIPLTAVVEQLHKQPLTGRIRFTHVLRRWSGLKIFKGDGMLLGRHGVLVVGYGGERDNAYFILQNSFGVKWGYKGYFKVLRTLVSRFYAPHGVCSPQNRRKEEDRPKRIAPAQDAQDAQDDAMGFSAGKRRCH